MKTPLARIRAGALVTVVVFVLSATGYRLIEGRSWLDSIYMVVITISTVGYGETSSLGPAAKALTVVVIVFGMSAAVYTFGSFLQLLAEGELERALGVRRMKQELERMDGHVIVCGFGRVGQLLAEELERQKQPFVIIEQDGDVVESIESAGLMTLKGDATDEDVLVEAGVNRAHTLVTALPNDAQNVFITLTSRNLNSKLRIIARGEEKRSQKKLFQAGADRVVLPAAIGAQRIAAMITRPMTQELLDLVGDSSVLEVEIDEMMIGHGSVVDGKTVGEADTLRELGLLPVAVKKASGEMVFNPPEDHLLAAGDTLIVMGRLADLDKAKRTVMMM